MYFEPTEYSKKIKISTRCHIQETLKLLEQVLSSAEFKWFRDHPQFKHIVHMPRPKNHKLMGMWMLLLRTASTKKKKEAWFVVNGVPIRYGIEEHALLSGLDCRNYPNDYMEMGSLGFANKHFKGLKSIRIQDVKEKLMGMGRTRENEKLKMAVLYFLGNILIGQTKTGEDATPVHPFFIKAVDDLELCKTFPWGRLSFDHMLGEIAHTMSRFKGVVNDGALWPIPGFVIPLEILAFEAIPLLGNAFREPFAGANAGCPRMCKTCFKKSETRGFPLTEINEKLSDTRDIESILVVRDEEKALLARITEAEAVLDHPDPVVDLWMPLFRRGRRVWYVHIYRSDERGRSVVAENVDESEEPVAEDETVINDSRDELLHRLNAMEEVVKKLREKVDRMEGTEEVVKKLLEKVAWLEGCVKGKEHVVFPYNVDDAVNREGGGSGSIPVEENVIPQPQVPPMEKDDEVQPQEAQKEKEVINPDGDGHGSVPGEEHVDPPMEDRDREERNEDIEWGSSVKEFIDKKKKGTKRARKQEKNVEMPATRLRTKKGVASLKLG